jgi:L-cysteine desulfidase
MNIESLFREILKPALGCTEPVAIALATAAAAQAAAGYTPTALKASDAIDVEDVCAIRVGVSRNIFKNAFAILIPNAGGRKGIAMSAALGVFCDPCQELSLFRTLAEKDIRAAEAFVKSRRVQVSIVEDAPSDLFIEVEVEFRAGAGYCQIRDGHANIACLKQNGKPIYGCDKKESGAPAYSPEVAALKAMSIAQVVDLVEDLPYPVLSLLRDTVEKNLSACKAGLSHPMGIGAGFHGLSDSSSASISQYVSSITAAGTDARMSGHPAEVMTSAGSGNQGIVATIPVVVYARMHLIDEDRMLKAVALAHLMTMYFTSYVGYLSALCGVSIKAGIGAACGLTYVMGGELSDIERAIKIMAATLTGMICDGAKIGCALKVSSTVDTALRAAYLATRKSEVPDDNGIVAVTAERTVQNLADLNRSMQAMDQKLIEIMLAKIDR